MKIHLITLILTLAQVPLFAQTKSDTITITVNGQKSQINNLEEGKKTTFSFEDSSTIYQISVSKISKNKLKTLPIADIPKINEPEVKGDKKKTTRWFGDASVGLVHYGNRRYTVINSLLQSDLNVDFQQSFGTNNLQITESTVKYDKISVGFRMDLAIKESKTKLSENLYLYRGFGVQYGIARAAGVGTFNTYKMDSSRNILYDSFISGFSNNVTANIKNFQFTFPFLFGTDRQFNNKKLTVMAGFVGGINISSSTIENENGEDVKSRFDILGNYRVPFFSFQPTVKTIYNDKLTLQLSMGFGSHKLGFGKVNSLTYTKTPETITYVATFNNFLTNETLGKKNQKKTERNLFLKSSFQTMFKSFYDKEHRNWLFKRFTNKEWLQKRLIQIGLKKSKPNT